MSRLKDILPQLKSWCAVNNISVQSVYDTCHGMTLQEMVYYLFGIVQQTASEVVDYQNAFDELKNFVDNYFKNLDVQEEINNKLDVMADDGTLAKIINEQIFGELNKKVDKNTSDISGLSQRMTAAEENIEQNTSDIDALKGNVQESVLSMFADLQLFGQSNGGSEWSPQCFCVYWYDNVLRCAVGFTNNDTSQKILIYNVNTGALLQTANFSNLAHINDISYDTVTQKLYVAPSGGTAGLSTNFIVALSPDTATVTGTYNLTDGFNPYGIAFKNGVAYVKISGNRIAVYNTLFSNPAIFNIQVPSYSGYTGQGCEVVGNYFLMPRVRVLGATPRNPTAVNINVIDVYNLGDMSFKTTIYIPMSDECENCSYYNGQLYTMLGANNYAWIYKTQLFNGLDLYGGVQSLVSLNNVVLDGTVDYHVYVGTNTGFLCDGTQSHPIPRIDTALKQYKRQYSTLFIDINSDIAENIVIATNIYKVVFTGYSTDWSSNTARAVNSINVLSGNRVEFNYINVVSTANVAVNINCCHRCELSNMTINGTYSQLINCASNSYVRINSTCNLQSVASDYGIRVEQGARALIGNITINAGNTNCFYGDVQLLNISSANSCLYKKSVGDPKFQTFLTTIQSGTLDLHEISLAGIYRTNQGVSLSNAPSDFNNAKGAMIKVMRGGSGAIFVELYSLGDVHTYVSRYYGSWSGWVDLTK